jgi:hypothetical protein
VRYLDLHKSHFNRYFRGHTKEVIHLDMSPKNDTFLTSSTVSCPAPHCAHVDDIGAVHAAHCTRIAAAAPHKAALTQLHYRWALFRRPVRQRAGAGACISAARAVQNCGCVRASSQRPKCPRRFSYDGMLPCGVLTAVAPPAAQDRSVRLWDLRTNICQAKLDTPAAAPCASFDQQVIMQHWHTFCKSWTQHADLSMPLMLYSVL